MHEVRKPDPRRSLPPRLGDRLSDYTPALLKNLGGDSRIVAGNAGDHPLVLQLLTQAYQAPLADDFQSRLDDPGYEPSDRILLHRADQLVGHVHVSKQMGWFQQQRCALAKFQDFVVLPEFRDSAIEQSLLKTAEETAIAEGAVVGLIRTGNPQWFQKNGWSVVRGGGHTQANTHNILAHFDSRSTNSRRRRSQLQVRTWRHFEADGLRRVYQQLATNMWGSAQRSEAYWQWLLGRKGHDQLLIAVKGEDANPPQAGDTPHIVGYAVIRDSAIVEMFALPGFPLATSQLAARACKDAIDRDHRFVSLHTPVSDPLHELLVTAGGSWIPDSPANGGLWMIKLLSPERWVERMYPIFHARSRESGLNSSQQVAFSVSGCTQRFVLTRRSSRLEQDPESAHDICCHGHLFQDLLLSNLAFTEARELSQLRATNPELLRTVMALFAPKLFWQSPLELLRL